MIQIKSWQKARTMQDECQREFIYLHTLFHRKRPNWWKRPPSGRFRSFFPHREVRGGGFHAHLVFWQICFDTTIMLAGKHKSLGQRARNPEKDFYSFIRQPRYWRLLNPAFHELVQLIFNKHFQKQCKAKYKSANRWNRNGFQRVYV